MDRKTQKTPSVRLENASSGRCEDCVYYDYDEITESYTCTLSLDEDEMAGHILSKNKFCKYYKYYDEYKFVNKQL